MSTSGPARSKSPFQHTLFMAALAAVVLQPLAARAEDSGCLAPGRLVSITGKIQMNMFGTGEALGSVHGVIEGMGRLRCGVNGKPVLNADGMTQSGYTDFIVCDDSAVAENAADKIHSQIVLASQFDGPPDFRSCGIPGLGYGTFREISKPQSGRGIFSPTGGGQLVIEGRVNCGGAMDMTVSGQVCVVR